VDRRREISSLGSKSGYYKGVEMGRPLAPSRNWEESSVAGAEGME
jgi:hypothetical protein